MIIGKGLIAKLFTDHNREDTIFFASGVSNSSETDPAQFKREEDLVKKTLSENPDRLFIYFSTCSIYDSSKTNSAYVLHKLHMEELVKTHAGSYLILRVSNAVGKGGNPNLLMNYLVHSVELNQTINVHTKATRNLIDAEDVEKITLHIIENKSYNRIINVAYPQNYSIIEILEILERHYRKKPDINLIRAGSGYEINIPDVEFYFRDHSLQDKETYLCKILEKYY